MTDWITNWITDPKPNPRWLEQAFGICVEISEDGLDPRLAEHLLPDEDGRLWIGPFPTIEAAAEWIGSDLTRIQALNAVAITIIELERTAVTNWNYWGPRNDN